MPRTARPRRRPGDLRAYRGLDWERLRCDERRAYGGPAREADTASEDNDADDD